MTEPVAIEQIEIPVGSMTFTARAAGPRDGRLVLLLHGFPQTSYAWRSQLEALAAAGYRAVAPDQRGYAAAARPVGVEHYAVTHLVNDVIAMAEWLSAHQFDLVGHDWGAAVAWQLAGTFPERLRTVTPVSVPHPAAFSAALADDGDDDQRQRSGYIEWFRREGEAEQALLADGAAALRNLYVSSGMDAGQTEEYLRVLTEPGALTAALSWYRAMDAGRFGPLGPIEVPTMYVWSTEDVALGRAAAEATGAHVTGPYRFEVLDGVSHWIPEQAADRLNALLLDFLAAHG